MPVDMAMLQPGARLQDRYVIEGTLGKGGMGTVYLARHELLGGRLVAIKEMNTGLDDDAQMRESAWESFRSEARLLASLSHPRIVRVIDFFAEAARQYLVMEYLQGRTLDNVLHETPGFLDPRTVTGWLIQCCEVLSWLHSRTPTVLMRDLKPSNLIVDDAGHLHLIDFGISKIVTENGETDPFLRCAGTCGYAPIEQLTGTSTARSDLYALGATAYVLLTRRVPTHALLRASLQRQLEPPRSFNPAVSPELEAVILRLLAQLEQDRYATADEARSALEACRSLVPLAQTTPLVSDETLPSRPPGQSASKSPPPTLPVFLKAHIARPAEDAALADLLLDPTVRILTILGMGGVGKTCLVTAAARCIHPRVPRIKFVPLADAVDARDAVLRIAGAFDIRDGGGSDLEAELARRLAGRDDLIILDSAEVLAEQPFLVELAGRAPHVKLVCTTRVRLHLEGETLFEVGGMEVPPEDAQAAAAVRRFPAITLFCERATRVRPGWKLNDDNASLVSRLCQRLHGHPLSIEMAASRLRTLTVEQVATRLDDRFRLLVADSVGTPLRQRTLTEVVDWSYRMLDAAERVTLLSLTVFQGGFWLESAEHVLGDAESTVDRIAALQDHSLLAGSFHGEERRHHLVESVRAFLLGRRAEELSAKSVEALSSVHAEHFCALIEAAASDPLSRARGSSRADLDIPNCRAALEWAAGAGRPGLAARLALSTARLRRHQGYLSEAFDLAMLGGNQADLDGDAHLQARARIERGDVLHELGRLEEAATELRGAIGPSNDGTGLQAHARNTLGLVLQGMGRYGEADAEYAAALHVYESLHDRTGIGVIGHNRAYLAQFRGHLAEAEREYRQALAHRQALDDVIGQAETANNLGELLKGTGRLAEAEPFLVEALAQFSKVSRRLNQAMTLYNLGELRLMLERPSEAEENLAAALHLFATLRSPLARPCADLLARIGAARLPPTR